MKNFNKGKEMTDEEIKKAYINSFGEEKWKEEEMLGKLIPVSLNLSNYLEVEMVPILFEDITEDSRLYLKEGYIAINEKYKDDYIECLKSLCHEYRHLYQLYFAKTNNSPKAKRLLYEFKNIESLKGNNDYGLLEIEIDAFTFTKWYLLNNYNINVTCKNEILEEIIIKYTKKYF